MAGTIAGNDSRALVHLNLNLNLNLVIIVYILIVIVHHSRPAHRDWPVPHPYRRPDPNSGKGVADLNGPRGPRPIFHRV